MNDLVDQIRRQMGAINFVSYSGGKDSTVVLQHVLAAIQGTDAKLYIVTSDTRMEIPYFQGYVDAVKGRIKAYIGQSGMNAELVTVYPKLEHTFWVSVLGMGYPAAHMGFRWCTGRLKIDPITRFTNSVIKKSKDYMVFVGVRSAESELRARIYQKKDYKANHYAPILDWSAHDVWEYLLTESCPWGDHTDLLNVYKYSSDECVYGEAQGVCVGNARYGCWACPLQKNSQLDMLGFHTGEVERYRQLKHFKNHLVGMANRTACRSRIRRNGSEGAGPFLVGYRRYLLQRLKRVEKATSWRLITPEEIDCIKRHWRIDANIHNVPDQTQPLLWGAIKSGGENGYRLS